MNGLFDMIGNIFFSILNAIPVLPVALVIILAYRHFNGGGRLSLWRTLGLLAFTMYMYSMLDLTIFSRLEALSSGEPVVRTLSPIPFDGIVTMATTQYEGVSYNVFIRNVLGNVIMFMPLGFFLPLLWPDMRAFGRVVAICALASFAIEFTQYWIGGISDIDDMMLNTAGACIGYGSYALACMAMPVLRHRFAAPQALETR